MNPNCSTCQHVELEITGSLLNGGKYSCSLGCDMFCQACEKFEYDEINDTFIYSYAS